MKFHFIQAQSAFGIAWLCRRLDVSPSGYYGWKGRGCPNRRVADDALRLKIRALFAKNRGVYGSPRIFRALRTQGEKISRKRVARIMREDGLIAKKKRKSKQTTDSTHSSPIAPNIVARDFTAAVPNELWLSDITAIRSWEGWVYLAVIIDAYSRMVVGWAASDHMRTSLVLEALDQARAGRILQPHIVFHSDRGSQYASHLFQEALVENGLWCSMSRRGNCHDNAVSESFFGTLKDELIYRHAWPTRRGVYDALADYIDDFYNCKRLHSTIGYGVPIAYQLEGLPTAMAA